MNKTAWKRKQRRLRRKEKRNVIGYDPTFPINNNHVAQAASLLQRLSSNGGFKVKKHPRPKRHKPQHKKKKRLEIMKWIKSFPLEGAFDHYRSILEYPDTIWGYNKFEYNNQQLKHWLLRYHSWLPVKWNNLKCFS